MRGAGQRCCPLHGALVRCCDKPHVRKEILPRLIPVVLAALVAFGFVNQRHWRRLLPFVFPKAAKVFSAEVVPEKVVVICRYR